MRVALNMIWLGPAAGGVGRYARELVGALLALRPDLRLHLVVSRDLPDDLRAEPWARDVRWEVMPVRLTGPPFHLAAQLVGLPALALARRVALVHGLANVVPVRVPGVRTVVTLHDLIWLHEGAAWGDARAVGAVRRLSLMSARGADRVLAVSHAAAHDFSTTIGLDAARIDVAPHGVSDRPVVQQNAAALRSRHELGEAPVILCVAQKRPYKNLAALIRALPSLPGAVLVLPGAPTAHELELRELARRIGVLDRVRFLGWVGDDELDGLYGLAACFALASRIEGFGLPVLEAMRRGVPVACADRGALAEVAGDAALLFDPDDERTVTAALRTLLHDEARAGELVRRGHERVRTFTWEHTAQLTLASYERALGSGGCG
ncbi:MAG: glycosyltransferase family 1 protein [Solirubrobacteraceae bacterium]